MHLIVLGNFNCSSVEKHFNIFKKLNKEVNKLRKRNFVYIICLDVQIVNALFQVLILTLFKIFGILFKRTF